ncbi:MAG: PAS domain S-box protein [Rhodospirillaceae bacterium]|nr:PAS domain S-box protein [Rhodospirillaceae bacterium]
MPEDPSYPDAGAPADRAGCATDEVLLGAALPRDEDRRLAVLRRYAVLDTGPEEKFDRITRIAQQVFQVPVCVVSLIDEGRQWFKSRRGLDVAETPRELSFCAHAILQDDLFIIADASTDARTRDNPLVAGEPHIRFYAGAPLINPEGYKLGTLCLVDLRLRPDLTAERLEPLRDLAAMVVDQFELSLAATAGRAEQEARVVERQFREVAEHQLRIFIEFAPAAIAMFDTEMRYLMHSRRWVTDHGITEPSLLGRRHYDVFPDLPQRWRDCHARALAGEIQTGEEDTVQRQCDGGTEWVSWEMRPWRTAGGNIGGIIVMTELVTDKVNARRELEANRQFLNAVLENVQDGILACDADGRITLLNSAARDLLRLPTGPLSLQPIDDQPGLPGAPSSQRLAGAEWPLLRALAGQRLRATEIAIMPPGGGRRGVLASGQPMLTADGVTLGAVVSLTDLTERIEYRHRIEESEQRFRGAFETSPSGMALVAPDGRLLAVNSALCELLGYSEDELLQTDFQSLTHSDDLELDLDYVKRMLDGEIRSYQMEKRYIHKEGHTLWALLSVSLVRALDGTPIHFVSQIVDLTDRRRTEEQLRHAQRMDAMGQLTGGIAHDFNNLLAVVIGNLQLATRTLSEDAAARPRIRAAIDAAGRGAELTKRLLAYSRQQPLEIRAVDANELVATMHALLGRTLGEEIELESVAAEGLWPCTTDVTQLESTILNLAINARDAMPDGGKLTIETANARLDHRYCGHNSEVVPGDYVMVAVSDTGCGIPRHQLDQVFQPFFTTKPKGRGTGLGLSMVYGFIKQTGGHIQIYSEVGHGTTVKLYLPRSKAKGESTQLRRVEVAEPVGGRETILVTEDDPAVRDVAVELLSDLGYRVLAAENGPAALKLLRETPNIDLLFSDVVMPGGMNGVDLADQVHLERPAVKILFASGYTEAAATRLDSERFAGALITKPYRREALAKRVREILDKD